MGRLVAALVLTSVVKLAVITAAALYPIVRDLNALQHFWDAWELYSIPDSNLDVWLLALLHAAVLAALLSQVGTPRRRYSGLVVPPPYTKVRLAPGLTAYCDAAWQCGAGCAAGMPGHPPTHPLAHPPTPQQVSHGVYWSCTLFELLLLGKAVVVAVLGAAALLPPPADCRGVACGRVGLLCMYVSIVAGLLASFLEGWLGCRLVAARRKQHEAAEEARSEAQQPLLGKKGGKKVRKGCLRGAAALAGRRVRWARMQVLATCSPAALAEPPCTPQEGETAATISELLRLSLPDGLILLLAFTAGAAAALGQALVPYFTGKIIDYASIDPNPAEFRLTTLKLLGVALGCAVFTGIRGGLFTVGGLSRGGVASAAMVHYASLATGGCCVPSCQTVRH